MQPEPPTDRWIGDYRSIGLCEWPAGLRESFGGFRRRATRRAFVWLALLLVVLVIAITAAALADRLFPRPLSDAVLITAVIAGGILTIPVILGLSDALRRRTDLGRLLQYSHVERFELSQHVRDEVAAARALGINASVEELPVSLFVIPAPPGHPQAPGVLVQVDQHAQAPPALVIVRSLAHRSEEPRTPITDSTGWEPLSPSELQELRLSIRMGTQAFRRFSIVYTLFSIGVAALALRLLVGGGIPGTTIFWFIVIPVAWLFMTWRGLPGMLRQRQALKMLRLDLAVGRTLVQDGRTAIAELRSAGLLDPREPIVNPGVVRLLPHSRYWWEVDGVPAAWRR